MFYFFNTFFYKKISSPSHDMSSLNWTNKENIFEYKYLIIPINQDCHWKVVIVHLKDFNEKEVINLSQDDLDDAADPLLDCILIFDSLYFTSNVSAKIRRLKKILFGTSYLSYY